MEFYDFPFSWECHHPNWLSLHHFSEGLAATTNQLKFPSCSPCLFSVKSTGASLVLPGRMVGWPLERHLHTSFPWAIQGKAQPALPAPWRYGPRCYRENWGMTWKQMGNVEMIISMKNFLRIGGFHNLSNFMGVPTKNSAFSVFRVNHHWSINQGNYEFIFFPGLTLVICSMWKQANYSCRTG